MLTVAAVIASICAEEESMPTLTIREVEEELLSAARHGRSMEAEGHEILREALAQAPMDERLGSRVRQRFAAVGGEDLVLPTRVESPRPAELL